MSRVTLIVLDSVGVGALPDAAAFGDEGVFTLGHVKEYAEKNMGGFRVPNLRALGLYNIDGLGLEGVDAPARTTASAGSSPPPRTPPPATSR